MQVPVSAIAGLLPMWRRSTRTGFSACTRFRGLLETLIRRNLTHADVVQSKRRSCSDWRLPIFADSCPQDLTLLKLSPSGSRPRILSARRYDGREGVQTLLPSHLIKFRQAKRSVMGLPGMSRAHSYMWRCPAWTTDPPAADGLRIGGPGRTHDYLPDQVRSPTTRSTHAALVIVGAGAATEDRGGTMQGDEWHLKTASPSPVMTNACLQRESKVRVSI